MRKIFTLLIMLLLSASMVHAETAIYYYDNGTLTSDGTVDSKNAPVNNIIEFNDGAVLYLTGNLEKAYSSANSITVNGTSYKSIKLSNGAENTFTAPEGKLATAVTLYSYVNYDRASKGSDGRATYWKRIDQSFTENDATIHQCYTDVANYGKNPDIVTHEFSEPLSEFIFANNGEQVCVVFEVELIAQDPLGDLKRQLQASIAEAEAKVKTDYTEDSYAVLTAALNEAKAELENPSANFESLQKALDNLNDALEALYPIHVSATYALTEGETHEAGDKVTVTFKGEDIVSLTFGTTGDPFKAAKKDSNVTGFTAYTEGNGINGDKEDGTAYTITPKYNGSIDIAVVLGSGKSFYILEDGEALTNYNGITVSEQYKGIYTFNVKANSDYKFYAAGSKLGFYGFNYSYDKTGDDPLADVKSELANALAAAEGIDWDLYTEDAAKALYNAICEAKEVLASDTAGEAEFTNATSALKNAFDDLENNLADQELPTISGPGMYSFFDWKQANTYENLKYDASLGIESGWSDIEKVSSNTTEDATKDNCFWLASDTRDEETGYLTVKNALYASDPSQPESVIIPELYGLEFLDGAFGRSLAIAVNYPSAVISSTSYDYKGGSYLWFGAGSGADYLVIRNVEAGSIITMGVESHKTDTQRGIELYVYNNGTKGAKLKNQYGYDVVTPKTYKNSTWLVPDAPAAIDDDDDANAVERYDILLHNTAGCHVYYIDAAVEQGPTTAITEVKAEETDAPVVYYNLYGVRVDNPAAGLYIRKQGNNVSKVIIK